MPTISAGDKVLVTGANGYIAMWVVQKLLEKGYLVRAAVRTPSKAKHLQEYFKAYGDKLELVYVPDIEKEEAFDEAAKGVSAILHTASPATLDAKIPRDVMEPAINGTVNLLKSALTAGLDIKRIVITSSVLAIVNLPPPAGVFTERDWNDDAIKHVEEKGDAANPGIVYCASKTLAERAERFPQAAWSFIDKNKNGISWDLAVVNPSLVFGPPIQELSSKEGLNDSMQMWWQHVLSEGPKPKETLGAGLSWVDVRDLAEGHVAALEKEEAKGQRIIISAGEFIWQEWGKDSLIKYKFLKLALTEISKPTVDLANEFAPSLLGGKAIFKGYPDLNKVYPTTLDTTKEKEVLGLKHHSKEETTRDILKEIAKRGW
ncbi:D-lactaldehyde dehydrogenase [Coprinopsis sp. MPI-PUGE-AT-0042]|nr:D-lactaldehyde dehydrogenase [Coprinopsis sp. MPI-PUGE-AT-0042]